MKLRVDCSCRLILTGLALLLASSVLAQPATGPAADYPMVLGAPFTIDGVTYTPADKMNFDQVGYAEIDPAAGSGISIAHRTLPLPSYAEVTSLRTGRTILVRVERRGPPSGSATVALSPAAAAQLGTIEARTPIRIRRVNPPEPERAALRAGQPAPLRMDTPMALVAVLMRKLEPNTTTPAASPSVPAASLTPAPVATAAPVGPKQPAVMPAQLKPASPVAPPPAPKSVQPKATASAAAAKPTPPPTPTGKPAPVVKPVRMAPAAKSRPSGGAAQVVQVGAYASRASAEQAAARVGGTVSSVGKLFRVRIGGLATPQAAAAALAKARAAGYSEARILHAD